MRLGNRAGRVLAFTGGDPLVTLTSDNHDSTIRFFHLLLEQEMREFPERPLPEGYRYVHFAPGDKDAWIAIERSAREFDSREQGEAAWERYFAGHEKELEQRMFFVEDRTGRKVATATAYYDIGTGDDGVNGWLHWVAVSREAQGKGLSKPLIAHTLNCLRRLGYQKGIISTQTVTWLACKIYLDLGFVPEHQNAKESEEGWRIIRTLTDHPALQNYPPVNKEDIFITAPKIQGEP